MGRYGSERQSVCIKMVAIHPWPGRSADILVRSNARAPAVRLRGSRHSLRRNTVPIRDDCRCGKINHVIRGLEHVQHKQHRHDFERLQSQEPRQFPDFYVLRHKNPFSWLAKIRQVPRCDLRWSRWRVRRAAHKGRLGFRCPFRRSSEFISAHGVSGISTSTRSASSFNDSCQPR
jgi:hypothetical protein